MKNDYWRRWFIKGKSMDDVSLSFILDYSRLCASLCTPNTANVWPILKIYWKLIPYSLPICPSTCQTCEHLPCCIRYSKPGQYTVTQPLTSCFLVDVSFSLMPELLLLLILFQVIFFLILHSYAWRRIHWGKVVKREGKEIALSCFLLIPGQSSPCSNSPTKPSGYFLIPLDDFQMFWLGGNLQFSMRSNTLVAAGKSLFGFIKPPQ